MALALVTVGAAVLMTAGLPGDGVFAREATQEDSQGVLQRTGGEAVGATVSHPAGWRVEREAYTYDGSYGFTLWKPPSGKPHDHGGSPALRVSHVYDLDPGDIEGRVRAKLNALGEGSPAERFTVRVGAEGHEGLAVGPVPGSTPYTDVYVPVVNRVYRINVYGSSFGANQQGLLKAVRFSPPTRSVQELGLPPANSESALYTKEDVGPAEREREEAAMAGASDSKPGSGTTTSARSSTKGSWGEKRIREGCWRASSRFFVQTQHGPGANSRRDGIPKGFSVIGVPNFWGQYSHGNLGYGRCTKPYNTNDKFAVDYPLNARDYVWNPFARGRVTFAGRNLSHKDYGIFVSIRAANGKYVSLSGHFSKLARGIKRGKVIGRYKVIGLAGKSGGGDIPVGRVHLHQAFYRYPRMNPDGSPYGGAGLQVARIRYSGTAAKRVGIRVRSKAYDLGWVRPKYKSFCREGIRCGEGYRISN